MADLDITLRRKNGLVYDRLNPSTTWTQVEDKPTTFTPTAHTHTKANITDFAHSHGNITDTGTITADTAIASGQKFALVNGSNLVVRSALAFGSSTTTFLRNDGQWVTPAGGGNVSGPGSSTPGNVPLWNNLSGTLLQAGLGISDSTSGSQLSINPNLVTERDVYYGTPTINNSKAYTSGTNIYAPTTGQTSSYFLVGNGTTSAPVWRFKDSDWETADQSITSATNMLTIAIPGAGTYKVSLVGAYYSNSLTIGVQAKFTFSGTLSNIPDSVFNFTIAQTNAATSGALHQVVAMNTAIISTSVAATNTDHGIFAEGQFTSTTSGTFAFNLAPETGSTQVGLAEGTVLTVEQVI
jgi:hypothetical protein